MARTSPGERQPAGAYPASDSSSDSIVSELDSGQASVELLHAVYGVCLVRSFVAAVPFDSGKAKGDSAGILRTSLYLVERHLNHQLRADVDRDPVSGNLQLQQPPGLPFEHLVGHALKCLPQHYEATIGWVPGAEM